MKQWKLLVNSSGGTTKRGRGPLRLRHLPLAGPAGIDAAWKVWVVRSQRAITLMESTFAQTLRVFVSGGSSAAPLGA